MKRPKNQSGVSVTVLYSFEGCFKVLDPSYYLRFAMLDKIYILVSTIYIALSVCLFHVISEV